MKNLSTYLVVMFMIMYWIFRIVLAVTDTLGVSLGVEIPNYTTEVILLFVTIVSIVLVIKRKLAGAILYVLTYLGYLGLPTVNGITALLNGEASTSSYTTLFVNVIGLAIPLFTLFEILLDRNRQAHPVDKQTDWFYKNGEYDREMDDRADKNNYRTL